MMDLPPDKERAMRQFDDEKKWDIVCDQVDELYIIFYLFIMLTGFPLLLGNSLPLTVASDCLFAGACSCQRSTSVLPE